MNRMFRALMFLVIIGGVIVGGVSELIRSEVTRAADSSDDQPVEFVIEQNQTASQIAASLREQGLIRQPLLFQFMVRQQGVGQQLQAGPYQLSKSMTMGQIISALQRAPSSEEISFQITPGLRMEEIAEALASQGMISDTQEFIAVASDAAPFKEKYALLESIPEGQGLEGYLFPDTYRIEASATVTDVIDKMLTDGFVARFSEFENEIIAEGPDGQPPTVHEIVTMASIIQREAANTDEMAHLSYIFWNRLKPENEGEVNRRLQADPTLQYALGQAGNWWPNLSELTADEINNNTSPYNTRTVQGLPPGPIANPQGEALRAAARPGQIRPDGTDGKDDLYFVARCDGTKAHDFAPTLDEFNALPGADGNCAN